MNKPIAMSIAALVIVIGFTLGLPAVQMVNAQYVGGGGATGGNIEEQLKLAREKIQNAQQAGAYGSGTPMFGTNINRYSSLYYYPGSDIWRCSSSVLR